MYCYPFGQFDTLIDVAGGLGGFTADVLAVHTKLKGIVLDQAQQIKRAKEVRSVAYCPSSVLLIHDSCKSKYQVYLADPLWKKSAQISPT